MSRMFLASGEAGRRRREPAVARELPCRSARERAVTLRTKTRPAHRRWHSTRRARTDARATSGRSRRELRGLRQRRRPAARTGLPARGRRARLRAAAGPRRAARLLALALALPRRRGHLPAERQRGRRLRADGRVVARACAHTCAHERASRVSARSRRDQPADAGAGRPVDASHPRTSPVRSGRPGTVPATPSATVAVVELDGSRRRLSRLHAGPARDREQHRVELVVGALLDPDLPALVVERDDVGAGERHQVADQLRGGAGCRRFDPDGGNGGPSRRRRKPGYLSPPAPRPRRGRPGPRRAPRA